MEAAETLEKFKAHVQVWKDTVNRYQIVELRKKQNDSIWSLGQVCVHVQMAHKDFFMKNAWICLNKERPKSKKGKNIMGQMIFFFKSIPPVKLKMPKQVAVEPPQPESVEQIIKGFDKIQMMMEEVEKKLPEADLSIKSKHPVLGMMHALEWFNGAEMHIRHHFLQKKRLEKFLEKTKSLD